MEKKHENLTWDDIKEMYAEIAEMQKETNLQMKETDRRFKETDKKFAETDRKIAETNRSFKKTERMMVENSERTEKKLDKCRELIGGISRSNGEFCEEYFINSFKENHTFMGEKYDYVIEYLRPYPNTVIADEYDLVLHNGTTVVIIEMKYKASIEDVGKMFSKLHPYRANYPMNKDYKVYLALASFRFPVKVRKRADEEGVVLIEQRGEKIEVISKNVKAW